MRKSLRKAEDENMIEEEKQARVSIGKIKKVCRVLDMLMKVIFVILTICWFFSLG